MTLSTRLCVITSLFGLLNIARGDRTINRFQRLMATMSTKQITCQRLLGMVGYAKRRNDVIVSSQLPLGSVKQHVIFFGGDVQDFPEKMHVCNADYVQWNLESTAELLAKRFPDALIMVIKPKAMFLNSISLYSNFVDFPDSLPEHKDDYGGLNHLVKLHTNVVRSLQASEDGLKNDQETCSTSGCETNVPVTLIGFSKGCVVLNQFVHELPMAEINKEVKEFLKNIKAIYWLDGGHNGGKDTWVTDTKLLKTLASYKYDLFVHVTPYQVMDPRRAWIGEEQQTFVKELKQFNANILQFDHHFDKKASIDYHFDVLKRF